MKFGCFVAMIRLGYFSLLFSSVYFLQVWGDSCYVPTEQRILCGGPSITCADVGCCQDGDQCYYNISSTSFEVDTATVSVKDGRRTYKVHTSSTSRSGAGPLCAQDGGTLLRLTSPYDQIWRVRAAMVFLKDSISVSIGEMWIDGKITGTDASVHVRDFSDYNLDSGQSCLMGSFYYDSISTNKVWSIYRNGCGNSEQVLCEIIQEASFEVDTLNHIQAGDLVDDDPTTCVIVNSDEFYNTYKVDKTTVDGTFSVQLVYNTTPNCFNRHVYSKIPNSCLSIKSCQLTKAQGNSCFLTCKCYEDGNWCKISVLMGWEQSTHALSLCEINIPQS